MSRSQPDKGPTVEAVASFLDMGGYGVYVWSAYGAAAAVLIGLVVRSLWTMKVREAALKAIEGDDAGGVASIPDKAGNR